MKEGNIIGLAGITTARAEPHQPLYGQANIYGVYMEIQRDSGVKDTVLLLFKEDVIDLDTMEEALPFMDAGEKAALIKQGQRLLVTGQVQTYKNYNTGHITVFVWADYIGAGGKVPQQNELRLEGTIGRQPIYRITPRGTKITEIILKTPSAFSEGYYSYIPVICWGRDAEDAAIWKEGDSIHLEGRLQSREYLKRYSDKKEEILTAYEVSASKIERTQTND